MGRKCPKGTICVETYTIFFLLFLFCVLGYFVYQKQQSHVVIRQPTITNYDVLRPIARPGISYNNHPSDTLLNPYSPPLQYNEPHQYKQVGYLKNSNYDNKLFPIFAKPIHLRRDKWYYYTIYDNIKIPIYSNGRKCVSEHGCDSLMNGDMVKIENMNDAFQVSMYDNHTLTYDPVL